MYPSSMCVMVVQQEKNTLIAKILQCLIPLQLFSRTRLYDSLYKYFICTINIALVYDVSFGQVLILDHQETYRG